MNEADSLFPAVWRGYSVLEMIYSKPTAARKAAIACGMMVGSEGPPA